MGSKGVVWRPIATIAAATIGLEAKGREGKAKAFYMGAILAQFLALLLRNDKATSFAHAAGVG